MTLETGKKAPEVKELQGVKKNLNDLKQSIIKKSKLEKNDEKEFDKQKREKEVDEYGDSTKNLLEIGLHNIVESGGKITEKEKNVIRNMFDKHFKNMKKNPEKYYKGETHYDGGYQIRDPEWGQWEEFGRPLPSDEGITLEEQKIWRKYCDYFPERP